MECASSKGVDGPYFFNNVMIREYIYIYYILIYIYILYVDIVKNAKLESCTIANVTPMKICGRF